jgi:pimeloyl-ACP methyl ester carboxylesterase
VAAAADFPLTALDTPGGASDWHVEDQLGDLRFLADQFQAGSYAVVGHSTGGTVALLSAQAPSPHDDRVRAAAVLSGDSCFLRESTFRTRALPMLYVGATRDLLVPAPSNVARAFSLSQPPRVLATLLGGTHLFFTDFALPDDALGPPSPTTPAAPLAQTLGAWAAGDACEPVPPPGTEAPLPIDAQHVLTARVVTAFLDEQFRGEPMSFDVLSDPRLQLSR